MSNPAIFHITHYKAGSQWVYAVLKAVGGEQRVVSPKINARHVTEDPIVEGMIYPCVYLTKENFYNATPPANHRKFIILRDLRDTLISQYFSYKYSHEILDGHMKKQRESLRSMSLSDGMVHILTQETGWMPAIIQSSWIHADDLLIYYEDLISDEQKCFRKIISYCGIEIDEDVLTNIINMNSFVNLTGRNRGIEDVYSHFRKGIAGDWKNYFDDKVKSVFKDAYGHILVATGYERDMDW